MMGGSLFHEVGRILLPKGRRWLRSGRIRGYALPRKALAAVRSPPCESNTEDGFPSDCSAATFSPREKGAFVERRAIRGSQHP